jgi:hypothetical protein
VQTFIAYYLNHTYKIMPSLGFSPLEGWDARAESRKLVMTLGFLLPESNTVLLDEN